VHCIGDMQIAAASMWTRKDVKEFKDSVKNDAESVIKVGSGEIVTVSL
jgi:golgi resident protein GCP60